MRLTATGKVVILIVVIGVAIGLWRLFGGPGSDLMAKIAPPARTKESVVPGPADLPEEGGTSGVEPVSDGGASSAGYTPPGKGPGCTDKPEVRFLIWAWNAQMGAMLANGGAQATTGSLMCKRGVNLKFIRQDDVGKMQEELVTFATELSRGNKNPSRGAHFVAIMGDGGATFLQSVNDRLRRIGPDYIAKVVGSCGYSRGEDKFMGPPAWKDNPSASRGGLVSGYLRDGDWNIAQKWLGDNGLRNNPDEKTWDPDALNWVAANDYIDAAEKYVSGYTEERPVVRNGKRTGQKKRVTVNSVVTWTPGDVTVAQKKGGLISIASTKKRSTQMPNVIIGIDRWMKSNRGTVESMLLAFFEGADQVRSRPQALTQAAQISAEVYKESDADYNYWEKYYKGVVEQDKQGLMVELGGSKVNNLADNLVLFGLQPGAANLFEATYRVFGDIVVAQYPELVPRYPPVSQILDTSYIRALAARRAPSRQQIVAAAPSPTRQGKPRFFSRRKWYIRFASGNAAFTAGAQRELEQLRRELLVASALSVEIHGHTDSQGNPADNMKLSESRAFAVKRWMEKKSPVNFPEGRVQVFSHGQANPVQENSTPQGRAANRRVEVVLRSTDLAQR